MIITIDGPAGSGKSTIAKNVAKELNFTYFDTGAMYRAVAFGLLRDNVDPNDIKAVEKAIVHFDITIDDHKHFFLDDEDITDMIRTEEVSSLASKASAYPAVRHLLVDLQRRLSQGVNAVFEGRDMGTVVFPEADVKVFLTATPEERAKRRQKDLEKADSPTSFDEILAKINKRDFDDSSREMSPMRPADDAHLLDTSSLTIEEVTKQIIQLIPGNVI